MRKSTPADANSYMKFLCCGLTPFLSSIIFFSGAGSKADFHAPTVWDTHTHEAL